MTSPEQVPNLGEGPAGAGLGQQASLAAPAMLGHLLGESRSISFLYNRASGDVNVGGSPGISFVNPAVADDNSPLPLDRFGFRFNYFHDGQQITGFGNAVGGTALPVLRNFNVEQYTFNIEKTFFSNLASVELRVPFATGLSSNLDLSAGEVTGPPQTPGGPFNVNPTPAQSLGREGTQFGNMTLIFKGLAYSSPCFYLSGGVALGIPSGDDTRVDIIDYTGIINSNVATVQRERLIHIDNETWSLSPYVAFLSTPTPCFFVQGFLQFDIPLNDSTINYTERFPIGSQNVQPASQAGFPLIFPTFPGVGGSFQTGISEQPLMQVDVGTGYWLLKDPSRDWLTGVAPTLELHYTTTLRNASIAQLPADTLTNGPTQEQPPRVGNLNNRVDILDLTVGTTFLFSNRASLATGFSFPLRGDTNRTFDWEFLLEFNYYFGARGVRAPNL